MYGCRIEVLVIAMESERRGAVVAVIGRGVNGEVDGEIGEKDDVSI